VKTILFEIIYDPKIILKFLYFELQNFQNIQMNMNKEIPKLKW